MLCPYALYHLSIVYIALIQKGLLAKASLFVWAAANEPQKNRPAKRIAAGRFLILHLSRYLEKRF
jgi:hypothetical protein